MRESANAGACDKRKNARIIVGVLTSEPYHLTLIDQSSRATWSR
jgi:hypothetical protein